MRQCVGLDQKQSSFKNCTHFCLLLWLLCEPRECWLKPPFRDGVVELEANAVHAAAYFILLSFFLGGQSCRVIPYLIIPPHPSFPGASRRAHQTITRVEMDTRQARSGLMEATATTSRPSSTCHPSPRSTEDTKATAAITEEATEAEDTATLQSPTRTVETLSLFLFLCAVSLYFMFFLHACIAWSLSFLSKNSLTAEQT